MQPSTILYIILLISIVSYMFEQVLDFINLKAQRKDIPDSIASFYDRDKYLKSLEYHREQTNFGFITAAFGFCLSMLMLVFGGFGMLDTWLRPFFQNDIVLALVFFGIVVLASDIPHPPFPMALNFCH